MRDTTIFYRSFYEAICELPATNQAEVYNAIFEYSLNLKEVNLTGLSKTIFTLIKPQITANIKRFENGKLPKEKQNRSKTKAKGKQKVSKTEANNNNNNNNNNNVFIPPTINEVELFFTENNYKKEAGAKAWNYYNDAKWIDSTGKKVKSWKQKMRGVWFKEENEIRISKGTILQGTL